MGKNVLATTMASHPSKKKSGSNPKLFNSEFPEPD